MKMIRYYGILPLIVILLLSCNMKDTGNYDYVSRDDFFPVKIAATFAEDLKNIEFIPQEPAFYEPVFDEMDDYDRYTYSWYAFYTGPDGYQVRVDIADTRILDLEHFPLNAGNYTIYFEVKDPEYNLQRLASTSITVQASPIGAFGVYIMKNDNGNTEIDYFKFNRATEVPALDEIPVYKNIVSSVFEKPISGKPVAMERLIFNYYWEKIADDGSSTTERIPNGVWFILSENDIQAVKADFSVTFKQFDGHFYTQPNAVKPQYIKPIRYNNFYFMNDNQIYGQYTMTVGVGRFPMMNRAGGVRASSAGMLSGNWDALFFDEISSEFLYAYGYMGTIANSATAEIKETTVLPNKEVVMNKLVEPIAIMDGGGTSPNSYTGNIYGTMILKHKQLANTYYMTKSNANGGVPFTWIRPIDADADVIKTPYPVMSSSYLGDVIYYAKNGNELWYYSDGGDTDTPAPLSTRQLKAATLGAGETIVNITPATYPYTGANYFAWVTVTTNTADGHYKFYAFENNGATPELSPTPKLVLTGEGEAVRPYIYMQFEER